MTSDFAPETLNDLTDYYLILDITPDASPSDIREAYLRSKATYQKDNVALYTLIDAGEREDMLRRIEEAYQVLSNSDRRREYDRFYGQISTFSSKSIPAQTPSALAPLTQAPSAQAPSVMTSPPIESAKIISIDRSTPVEPVRSNEIPHTPHRSEPRPAASLPSAAPTASKASEELEKEITEQTEWSGAFIRKVREGRGVSIEEVTQATKITKAYILAIEEENYSKLPAAVFIRGFVGQLARLLKLPHQQVSASYMSRLQRSNPEKFR